MSRERLQRPEGRFEARCLCDRAGKIGSKCRRAAALLRRPSAGLYGSGTDRPLALLAKLPNGKIDRKALPAPSRPQRAEETRRQSPAEQAVAAAFAETLGISPPALDDSFFGLGGDSISAIRLVGLLRRKGLKATPKDVFDHKTVAKLASVARTLEGPEVNELKEFEPDAVLPTPILRWFAELGGPADGFFQSTCLMLPKGVNAEFLQTALGQSSSDTGCCGLERTRLRRR